MHKSYCSPRAFPKALSIATAACCLAGALTVQAQWSENFDSYASGSQVAGQGGWQGWDGVAAAGALVSSAQSLSTPNSIAITGASDLVQKYSGYTSGQWIYRAWQYIPTSLTTGSSYFILLNTYNDGGPYEWSIQTTFDLAAGTLEETMGTSSTIPIIRGRWVELRYEIDLAANTVMSYYDGALFSTHPWRGANGADAIAAVDLYAGDAGGTVYYDDLSLRKAPKTIVVNTADNSDVSAGKTNLVTAINLLGDGDTINFNIPGAGPHLLVTPAIVTGVGGGGGYPEITNNNVTINGYSQPGASPNSNPINAANNAQIKIVIDGRAGGAHTWDISGYGTSESGQFVVSGNNVNIKGLSFLGIYGEDSDASPKRYAVALGNRGGHDTHINGCWIGVAPDGTTVAGFADGITGFRHRTPTDVLVNRVVVGVKAGSANPRAEFNVMVDMCIPIIIEGSAMRISGNFIGVLPNGLTRVPNPNAPAGFGWEGYMELARDPNNIVIGTDGDGVNDADEGNYLGGGVHPSLGIATTEATYEHLIEFYGGGVRTNIIIAGNRIGVGVDGTTYFTNATRLINGWGAGAQVQIGSDFDGVSDALEANVIANNHPFNVFYGDLTINSPTAFAGLDAGEIVSVRGNVLVNNNLAPYTYSGRTGTLPGFVPYAAPFMDTTSSSLLPLPVLDKTSAYPSLKGTFPVGINSYTNIIVDVYRLDPEGWTNGIAIAGAQFWPDLSDFLTYTNGFPQGSKYLGSFPVANTGSFNVNVSSLDLGSGTVTAAVNYSANPPGTRRAITHTGNFANPVTLQVPPTLTITRAGSSVTISWSRGTLLQSDTLGASASWTPVPNAAAPSYTFTPGTGSKFYRAQVQ